MKIGIAISLLTMTLSLGGCSHPDEYSSVPVTNNPNLLPSSQTAQGPMFGN